MIRHLTGALVLAMTLVLSACGGSGEAEPNPAVIDAYLREMNAYFGYSLGDSERPSVGEQIRAAEEMCDEFRAGSELYMYALAEGPRPVVMNGPERRCGER